VYEFESRPGHWLRAESDRAESDRAKSEGWQKLPRALRSVSPLFFFKLPGAPRYVCFDLIIQSMN
jgi:hypothetical protein